MGLMWVKHFGGRRAGMYQSFLPFPTPFFGFLFCSTASLRKPREREREEEDMMMRFWGEDIVC